MKKLFEPVDLGHLTIKNRLIRSATMETDVIRDGLITPELKEEYVQLAKGGVGLIITGMMGIGPNSRVAAEMVGTEKESFVEKLGEMVESVHAYGCKLVVQLSHCGCKVTQLDTQDAPRGASPIEMAPGVWAKEMSKEEIAQVVADFGAAAERCKQAGADGVQIHAAHAYLLSQFLSPYFNQRTDEYGGSIENRARIVLEVYRSVRQAVGEDYPILIKINYRDLVENGLTGEECIRVCQMLEPLGLDAAEVSSGINVDRASASSPRMRDGRLANFNEGALAVAAATGLPVISVSGHRDRGTIEQFLDQGKVVAISMSRPFLREPDLPAKWERGDPEPAKCVSCNQCFKGEYNCKLIGK